jgi:hypothetical protein
MIFKVNFLFSHIFRNGNHFQASDILSDLSGHVSASKSTKCYHIGKLSPIPFIISEDFALITEEKNLARC